MSAQLDRFTVLQRLGAGGMAEVFKCRQRGLGGFEKLVVLKRILPHLAGDESFVAMFLDEARIAANLSHPNIVQVFEIAADPRGVPFIVMEYVRGATLAQLISQAVKQGKLDARHMARLVEGAARGLHHAHHACDASGRPLHIVHRDVSPHNVLVTLEGCAKVADFGVARAEGRLTHTQAGVVKGKVRFTAPEVLVDPEQSAHARSDVFSLGVCLYVATTGQHPFNGPTDLAVMEAIHRGEYAAPSTLVPGYPPELEQVVACLLEHDPARRCESALAAAEALRAWLGSSPGSTDAELAPWVAGLASELLHDTPAPAPVATKSMRAPAPPPPPPAEAEVLEELDILVEEGATSALRTRRATRWWALVAAVLMTGSAGGAVWLGREQAEAARKQDLERTAWLDEAARQLAAGHFLRAEELLKKGAAVPDRDTADELRLTQLEADLRSARTRAAAQAAIQGGDLEAANTLLQTLLSLEAGDARALALAKELKDLEASRAVRVEPTLEEDAGLPELPEAGVADAGTRVRAKKKLAALQEAPDAGAGEVAAVPTVVVESPRPVEPPPVAVHRSEVQLQRAPHAGPLLKVTATARAQVFVDGLPVGWTPLSLTALSASTHLVTVWAEGHESVTERVTVGSDEQVTAHFPLRSTK